MPLWERDLRWGVVGTHALRTNNGAGGRAARSNHGGLRLKGSIKDMVADRLSRLLWVPLDKLKVDASLSSIGIDSMIASELRHWLYQTFKANISMMELLAQEMTVERMAELLKK